MMRTGYAKLAAIALGLTLLAAAPAMAQNNTGYQPMPAQQSQAQVTQPQQGGVNWQGVGYGAGTVAANLLYIPAKVLYGVLGGITGGGAYLLTGGNTQTSDTIWRSTLGGDYVITPDMIKGKQPVHFSGPTQTPPPPAPNFSSPPAASGMSGTSGSGAGASMAAAASPASGGSPITSTSIGPASRPIDRGAGPVTGKTGASVAPAAPLPDTSIE
jgi:hypothetical protein